MYAALFLYEPEQGKIENRLEEWWVRLDDQRDAAVSRHTAFMREVARLVGQGFDRLFGHQLFSVQAFGVSSALSMATYWAAQILLLPLGRLVGESVATLVVDGVEIFLVFTGCIVCGIMPSLRRSRTVRLIAFLPMLLTVLYLGISDVAMSSQSVNRLSNDLVNLRSDVGVPLMATVASFACDLLFIAATRRLLRWSAGLRRFSEIAAVILLNSLIGVLFILGPYLIGNSMSGNSIFTLVLGDMFGMLSALNVVDGLVASVFIFLAVSMLAHRLFWPLINRPLYALRERGVRRAVFATVGVALLAYAGLDVPELVKQLIEKGAG